MMDGGLTLRQLLCFEAVVTESGFQAAAEKLSPVATDRFVFRQKSGSPIAAETVARRRGPD
jgi:hypothetical protein